MKNLKKIFVPTYIKEDKKDIATLLYLEGLAPVFYEDEHPYSDEIDGMEINVHTAGIFNCACESAKKYNAIAVPHRYIGNADVNELITYCQLKKISVYVFDIMGNCLRPGLWDKHFVSRFEPTDACTQTDAQPLNQQPAIANEQA
jgi:hypothetical protein